MGPLENRFCFDMETLTAKGYPTQPFMLYEDNHLWIAYKPPGWIVQGALDSQKSLFEWAKDQIKETHNKKGQVFLGVVHRLDGPAQGIVVFAKTSKGASRLSEQIRNRNVSKKYYCVVENTSSLPVSAEMRSVLEGGKESSLRYKKLKANDNLAFLEVDLETGRKHQIRIMFSEKGMPIFGDAKYGSGRKLSTGSIALECYSMGFQHPIQEKGFYEVVLRTDLQWSKLLESSRKN